MDNPTTTTTNAAACVFFFLYIYSSPLAARRTLTDTAADCNCTVLFAAAAAPLLFTTTFYSPPPPPDNNAREPMSPADKRRGRARLTTGRRTDRQVAIDRGRERPRAHTFNHYIIRHSYGGGAVPGTCSGVGTGMGTRTCGFLFV